MVTSHQIVEFAFSSCFNLNRTLPPRKLDSFLSSLLLSDRYKAIHKTNTSLSMKSSLTGPVVAVLTQLGAPQQRVSASICPTPSPPHPGIRPHNPKQQHHVPMGREDRPGGWGVYWFIYWERVWDGNIYGESAHPRMLFGSSLLHFRASLKRLTSPQRSLSGVAFTSEPFSHLQSQ